MPVQAAVMMLPKSAVMTTEVSSSEIAVVHIGYFGSERIQ
jgi:hypothetical protein